ncbi:MAG: hypothetical protein RBJ76_01875 [Stenomitos frigidus ULC029]
MSSSSKLKKGKPKPPKDKKVGWGDDDPNPLLNVEPVGRSVGKAPRSNQEQNAQINALVRSYGLNKKQRLRLHQRIGGQGYPYDEIKRIIDAGDYFQADGEAEDSKLWLFEVPF